jgi:hypothetical protein
MSDLDYQSAMDNVQANSSEMGQGILTPIYRLCGVCGLVVDRFSSYCVRN